MPTRSANTHFLGETSEPNADSIASQPILANHMAKLEALTTGLDKINKKVDKLMTDRESFITEKNSTTSQNNHRDHTNNPPNCDTQYLKNIEIDVPNLDGRHDSQLFIN